MHVGLISLWVAAFFLGALPGPDRGHNTMTSLSVRAKHHFAVTMRCV